MRRADLFAMERESAIDVLRAAPSVHLAAVIDGAPILRVLHGVVVEDGAAVVFHGGRSGDKSGLPGCCAVISAHEQVVSIPSWMRDPERACPATTFYRSVQARGIVEEVAAQEAKAAHLQALMTRFQPEGGYRPITADDPLYERAVRGLRVLRLPLDDLTGRAKLGQRQPPAALAELLRAVWRRGQPGDARAVALISGSRPDLPSLFPTPDGTRAVMACPVSRVPEAVALLDGAYWNQGVSLEAIAEAHAHSSAWVGVVDERDRLVATARALSDRGKVAWIYDVAVSPDWQGRGVGSAAMRLLLDHPAVRGLKAVLGTRDAQSFYARLGFSEPEPPPWARTIMARPGSTATL